MPTSDTFKVIYLGQQAIIDPYEGTRDYLDLDAENAGALVGRTFDDLTNDSVQTFSPGSYGSNDGTGHSARYQTYNQDNRRGDDWFRITDSDGNETQHAFDAVVQYSATITYGDGSMADLVLNIAQDKVGNTWVMPPSVYSQNAALLSAGSIQSIKLTGVVSNTFNGLYYLREDLPDIVTVPCFAEGTLIRTSKGDVPVEALKVGDLVITRDRGAQPVRWLGSRHLDAAALQATPRLRPIRITAGALGDGLPEKDLLVSPQHRVLVRSRIAQRMFGTDEVLIAAKALVMMDGVDIDSDVQEVDYFHIMFDQHEVIFSDGAETESFYAGAEALKGVGLAAQEELFTLFPELRNKIAPEPVRAIPSGRMGRKLAMRHLQNRKPLQMN